MLHKTGTSGEVVETMSFTPDNFKCALEIEGFLMRVVIGLQHGRARARDDEERRNVDNDIARILTYFVIERSN